MAGRVFVGNWGGGGLNIFFGAEIPTRYLFPNYKYIIRHGVIYYAGKFLPQMYSFGFIMRGNPVSHCVDRPVFGAKYYSKISSGN